MGRVDPCFLDLAPLHATGLRRGTSKNLHPRFKNSTGRLNRLVFEARIDRLLCFTPPSIRRASHSKRRARGRAQVIGKTRYFVAGYALADSMVAIVMALLAITDWPRESAWCVTAAA